jgi:pilus assembly protein FimV
MLWSFSTSSLKALVRMMSRRWQADAAVAARAPTTKPNWRATALALAAAALFGTVSMDAGALALGRVTVQSALGEPLRAEVDIAEITPDELASLKANVASPDAFRAAGLEYSPALAGVEVTLKQRANGRPYLLLTSSRPVNDPFIDLILETQWASGRIVRDYTMLFDPPQLRQGSATAPAAPLPPVAQTAPQSARPAPVRPSAMPQARTAAPAQQPPVATARRTAPAEGPAGDAEKVTVQRGDSAGRIASAHKPPTVSLDQMLVALLQANPDAFSGGNVNRLKAGAVLQIPSADQAAQQSPQEASRTIVAQSRDFNDFRRRLAEGLRAAPVTASERQASGKVQAEVQDKTPAPATPDKLTLSKGAVQGKAAAAEDKIARDRQAQDAATRLAELNKNIADLNKLQSSTGAPAAAAASAKAPAGPAVPVPPALAPAARASAPATAAAPAVAPVIVPSAAKPAAAAASTSAATTQPAAAAASAPAPLAQTAASAPVAASVASAASAPAAAIAAQPASAPAVKAPATIAKKPAPAPLAVEEPSLLDDLIANPLVLAAGGVVLALLAGFGAYRFRQRKKSPQVDSSFLESRLQPDSFFGGSGGQRIDTNEGSGATGSSMVYSPSQLDAAGDVDPVAEADVYLAYGRDLQAEEILKEALRVSPHRVAIHSKLLEIYAKRRDAKAFEVTATDAYGLTHGEGLEWEHICELGRELDPSNALYRPGGAPTGDAAAIVAEGAAARAHELEAPATTSPDLDLDLDFSSGDAPRAPGAAKSAAVHLHDAPEPQPAAEQAHGIDQFGNKAHASQAAAPVVDVPSIEPLAAATPAPAAALDEPLSFELPIIDEPQPNEAARGAAEALQPAATAAPDAAENGLSFDLEPEPGATPAAAPLAAAAPAPAADDKMIEFDLGSLSLDLDNGATPETSAPATAASSRPAEALSPADDTHSTQGLEQDTSGDPLATKFALAQEFNAIGDPDGARSLAEEVLAEASGELKSRAQKFLAEIG